MKIILIIGLLFISSSGRGSTFVGNGGSWLDPELSEALYRIEEILDDVEDKDDIEGCQVTQCEVLDTLSERQYRFSIKFFLKRKNKIVKKIRSRSLKFKWTSKPITIKGEGDREFSAVAHGNTITLSEETFGRLTPLQRMSLLIHEINHLIPHKGEELHDRDKIGPFKGQGGVRQLLDLQGTLLVASASSNDHFLVKKDKLSSPISNLFLQYQVGKQTVSESEAKRLFFDQMRIAETSLDYFPALNSGFGFYLATRKFGELKESLVTSSIEGDSYHIGVNYRKRLTGLIKQTTVVEDRLFASYVDRIFLQTRLNAGWGSVEQIIGDPFSQIKGEADYASLGAELDLYFPIVYGFWFQLGVGLQWQDYEITETNFRTKSVYKETNWGISYAFTI